MEGVEQSLEAASGVRTAGDEEEKAALDVAIYESLHNVQDASYTDPVLDTSGTFYFLLHYVHV